MKGYIKLLMLAVVAINLSSCKDKMDTTSAEVIPEIEKKMFPTTGSVEFLDDELATLIDRDAKIEVLADGFDWSEGPLWLEETQSLIFSDVPTNTVYSWSEEDSTRIYLKPSGYTSSVERGGEMGSNGLTLGPGGQLVLAQHGNRQIAMMDADLKTPASKFIALSTQFEGKKFNSPNDVIFSKDGTMFFTDPPYGLEKGVGDPKKELDYQGVFRKSPNNEPVVIDKEVTRPNGVALSPDETKLYVASSDPKKAIWMQYNLGFNLNALTQQVFADMTHLVGKEKGLPDGMKVKSSGHLFASGPGGILVFTPEGKHLGTIKTGESTSNCAFDTDEKHLYMTADGYLMRIALIEQSQEM